jgi:hypothetical protein
MDNVGSLGSNGEIRDGKVLAIERPIVPGRPVTQRTGELVGNLGWRYGMLLAVLLLALALAGTLLLYHEAPALPFFFDDMIHLRWLDWHSLPSIWNTAEGLGYYRPLTMTVWKVDDLLFGRNDPERLHLLNLVLHSLNSVLAGLVAWRAFRGRGRAFYALLVGLIFLTFPFSYQAVPSTSSLSKPLIASLTLGSVLFYWEARRRHAWWLVALSLLLGFLAPFAYEDGVTVPLAIVSVEVFGRARGEFDRLSPLPGLHVLLIWGIALPLVVLHEPATGAALRLPSPPNLWQNGVYLLQGLLFPIAPLASPLARALPSAEYVVLAVVELLGAGLLLAFYHWAKQMALLGYIGSWFVVAVLPLWLMLDFSYVITSPRILYLAGLAGALLWAGVPVFLWTKHSGRWWVQTLAVVGLTGMLAFNVGYVRQKMVLASAIAAPLWQAVEAAEAQEQPASLLYVNVPAWIAPKQPIYYIGTEGLTFVPEYVRVQDFVYVNAGFESQITACMFDPAKQDWPAYIGYAGDDLGWEGLSEQIRRASDVYLTTYAADGLHFVEAGGLEPNRSPATADNPVARFGDQILLLKDQLELAGSELTLTLWWYDLKVPEEDVTIFVHVYDEAGQLVAQGDGYSLAGLFPALQWQPGDLVRDVRHVTLPDRVAAIPYTVAVGWYSTAGGHRLPAFDQLGSPVVNDAVAIYRNP